MLQEFIDVADDPVVVEGFAQDIELPLLEAALEKIGEPLDVLIAFVTDQPTSVGEVIWRRDTIETGRLIKYLFENNIGKFAGKVKHVELKLIKNRPDLYDEMIYIYPSLLEELVQSEGLRDAENEVFISLTGGTPACNIALLYSSINAMSVPGYKRYLYTSESDGKAQFLQAQTVIGRVEILKFIERLINRWDYDGVLKLLDSSIKSDKHLINMLKALESRLNFRFEDIESDIHKSLRSFEGNIFCVFNDEAQSLIDAINTVDNREPTQPELLFNELYWNLYTRFSKGNYVDFISRFYGLDEGMLRLETCRINKCSAEDFKKLVDIKSEKPTRRCLYQHILRNRTKANPVFVQWISAAENMVSLRHGTIHDMKGLSKRRIEKEWGGDILADTRKMLENYFKVDLVNPFDNEWVIEYCHQVL